jgi:prevent-host-death family protein
MFGYLGSSGIGSYLPLIQAFHTRLPSVGSAGTRSNAAYDFLGFSALIIYLFLWMNPFVKSPLCDTILYHMKSVTVRDLRNRFGEIAKWIQTGEPVTITRRGNVFATLVPAVSNENRKVDWSKRIIEFPPVGKGMSHKETEKLWSDLRD